MGRVQVVYESPCQDGRDPYYRPDGASEFFDWVEQNPYLDAGDPRPVVIGGRTGLAIDVVVSRTPTAE